MHLSLIALCLLGALVIDVSAMPGPDQAYYYWKQKMADWRSRHGPGGAKKRSAIEETLSNPEYAARWRKMLEDMFMENGHGLPTFLGGGRKKRGMHDFIQSPEQLLALIQNWMQQRRLGDKTQKRSEYIPPLPTSPVF